MQQLSLIGGCGNRLLKFNKVVYSREESEQYGKQQRCPNQRRYIACGYTDMRKQINGLAALVQTQFGREMDETSSICSTESGQIA